MRPLPCGVVMNWARVTTAGRLEQMAGLMGNRIMADAAACLLALHALPVPRALALSCMLAGECRVQ